MGDLLYFTASTWDGQRFLAVTDGTREGTFDFRSSPQGVSYEFFDLTDVHGQLYFRSYESGIGLSLGVADGENLVYFQQLPFGTSPQYNHPNRTAVTSGEFYFINSWSGNGGDLWRSDGTPDGTYKIVLAGGVPTSLEVLEVEALGDELYFIARDHMAGGITQIWKTDGTWEGTLLVANAAGSNLTAADGKLFFEMSSWQGPGLWMLDGSPQGYQLIAPLVDFGFPAELQRAFVELNGSIYFLGGSTFPNNPALWRTTGPGDLERISDEFFFRFDSGLNKVGNFLYFVNRLQVYLADGTSQGTHVLPIHPADPAFQSVAILGGGNAYSASNLAVLGDNLYFGSSLAGGEPSYLRTDTQLLDAHLFYNDSVFDQNDPALTVFDMLAVAPDKSPYRAGDGLSTFNNVSSYPRGINGVMLDFAFLEAELTAEDFVFRVGKSNDPKSWSAAPAPLAFATARAPNPFNDLTDRAFISWANGAITNTWLEVTVLANERTGLAQPEVFYFGSKVGDSGTDPASGPFQTTPSDSLQIFSFAGSNKAITDPRDYNRDGQITPADSLLVFANAGTLVRLNLPALGSPQAAPLVRTESTNETADQAVRSALSLAMGPETPLELLEVELPRVTLPAKAGQAPSAVRDLMFAAAYERAQQANGDDELDESLLSGDLLAELLAARARR